MDVGAGLYMYDVVVEKFTFAISSPDEFLYACHPCTFINKRNDHTPHLPVLIFRPAEGRRLSWHEWLFTNPCRRSPIRLGYEPGLA